jgi:hypothetical protein
MSKINPGLKYLLGFTLIPEIGPARFENLKKYWEIK